MDSYKEAEKINEIITKIYHKNPLTKKNALNWLSFCRTITSGLDILQIEARDLLRLLEVIEKKKSIDNIID